jgi:hypothetical protein
MATRTMDPRVYALAASADRAIAKKKSSAKKKSKSTQNQEAVRYLRYELTNSANGGTETSHYIDLARDLSAINRRLMRQGRYYHVKRVSIVSSNTIAQGQPAQNAGRVTVGVLPESWVTKQAWHRGFRLFNQMHQMANTGVGNDIRGKWADFKVHLSNDSRTATLLVPKDNGGNNLQLGEWNYSTLVTPDGTTSADEFELHMLGDHQGAAGSRVSVGLVKSYGDSRATVDADPTVPTDVSDDPLTNLFDDGTVADEIMTITFAEGDNPPYSITEYPGADGNLPKPIVVQQTTLGADGRASVGGFKAMCGLLELETTSPIANDVYSVLVELAPGKYRGIAADVI